MGGHYTFKAAATDRFDAAVAFYGMVRTPDGWQGPGPPIEPLAVAARCARRSRSSARPTRGRPRPTSTRCAPRGAAATDCEIVVVEGADHGFVHDPDRPVHRADDAAACWDRAIAWMLRLTRASVAS